MNAPAKLPGHMIGLSITERSAITRETIWAKWPRVVVVAGGGTRLEYERERRAAVTT